MPTEDDLKQLYNRQVYVVGAEAQRKYGETSVLLCGLTGLGCEIAKNLVLTGIKQITLLDSTPIQPADVSSLFYAGEDSFGKPRAATVQAKVAELNRHVSVEVGSGSVTKELIAKHNVVCFVDYPTTHLLEYNEWARETGAKFISAESRGIAGVIFVDCGAEFTVVDFNGEECVSCLVTSITSDGVVTCNEDKKHECSDGDMVYFTDIVGFDVLNSASSKEQKLYKVSSVCGPFSVKVDAAELASSAPFVRGGYMHTTKQPVKHTFKSLKEAIADPEIVMVDDSEDKLMAGYELHAFFRGLHDFMGAHDSKLPESHSAGDAAEVLALVKKYNPDSNEKLVTKLAKCAKGNLNPVSCFLGGLAAQEVLKVASGKFTPVKQFLYFDAREVLPDDFESTITQSDAAPRGTRYDGQAAVFGQTFCDTLRKKSCFIVGAGALGCELIKNVACMGLGTDGSAQVSITDMDTIELSNLSRQFLFRTHHIGLLKSKCAAESAKDINPAMKMRWLDEKVAPETENVFDDEFWDSLDVVANALDNVIARKYVDSRCVYYHKPLLESGTLGTKCNVQVVIPRLTESYGSSHDPPDQTIPICTLKNFPSAIEHTIQWARDQFQKYYATQPTDINNYLHDPNFMAQVEKDPGTKPAVFTGIIEGLAKRPESESDCAVWARHRFDELFVNNIKLLLHNLPLDKLGESGQPFWSGAKRPPEVIEFDINNEMHQDFIFHAAKLYAETYGIKSVLPREELLKVAATVAVEPFTPHVAKFSTDEKDKTDAPVTAQNVTAEHLPPKEKFADVRLNAAEFEKDDDANHHIDFITVASNLRASTYKIPVADRDRTKMIAGRIIPAMVTTTAMVTGLVGIEMYKAIRNDRNIDNYRNAFVNIALPIVAFSSPIAPAVTAYGEGENAVKWTIWDRIEIDGGGKDITLREFLAKIESEHKLEVGMMSCGSCMIYSFFNSKAKERMGRPVAELFAEIAKTTLPPKQRYLTFEACCTLVENGEDVDVPSIRYKFR